jgi:hypothetical protein
MLADDANSGQPFGDPQFEQSVRDTAYFLWENEGRPEGREQEYWYRALEQRVRQRQHDRELAEPPVEATRPPPLSG